MGSSDATELSKLESAIAEACRRVSGHAKPISPHNTVNLDLGIAGDDGDELAGEIISSTGLAIGPELDFSRYFGGEASILFAPLVLFGWKAEVAWSRSRSGNWPMHFETTPRWQESKSTV